MQRRHVLIFQMGITGFILTAILTFSALTASAQLMPSSVNSALYALNNEGVDTLIVYFPSYNDQLPEREQESLPFYIFWRLNGKDFCNKFSNSSPLGEPIQIPRSEVTTFAAIHFDEIENEEILEPYYRQIQQGDTVWIMFPPTSYLKDVLLLRTDGRQVLKYVENASLDAKEYFNDGMFNIHYAVNLQLNTAILRKFVKAEIAILEKCTSFSPKQSPK